MYTFVEFIDEQRKVSVVDGKLVRDLNEVPYAQYIDWVLTKQAADQQDAIKNKKNPPQGMTAVELLFQLTIINAYQLYCASLVQDNVPHDVPEVPADIKAKKNPVNMIMLNSIARAVGLQAKQLFEHEQAKTLGNYVVLSFVVAALFGLYMNVFANTDILSTFVAAAGAFLGLTLVAVFVSIGSDMMGNKIGREQAYDKAESMFTEKPVLSLIKEAVVGPVAAPKATGFDETLNATAAAILTGWKGAYAGRCDTPSIIDLNQVKVELDTAKKQVIQL